MPDVGSRCAPGVTAALADVVHDRQGAACTGIELLQPAPDDMLQRWPVSKRVNSSKAPAEDATLIDRIELEAA
jgi:hypothetical protein